MAPLKLASAALAALLLLGCGPIEYVNQVTRRASSDVERAKEARADKWAPYEYTLAVEYLHKAREEASFADFQAANRFGRRAAEAAVLATKLATARAASPERAAAELPPKDIDLGEMAPLDDADDEPAAPKGNAK